MGRERKKPRLSAIKAVRAMRDGEIEPIADYIENCGGDLLFMLMDAEDRKRLARALRTGSPNTRSEKRTASFPCKMRDLVLMNRLFYWFGFGLPGFSHTDSRTAFHFALRDYEKHIFKGAPTRTPESLYRHVWKPYLDRLSRKELTTHDLYGIQRTPLGSFSLGLAQSEPTSEEAKKRLEWFEETFLKAGETFFITPADRGYLESYLKYAGISPERWRPYIAKQNQMSVQLSYDKPWTNKSTLTVHYNGKVSTG